MKKHASPVPSILACLVIQLCVGIIYLWSVFKSSLASSYGNWEGVSMVASYMLLAFVLGNFAGGCINDKKGPKVTVITGVILFSVGIGLTAALTESTIGLMYLTYCVMGGLGSGIAYGACISCIQKWLPDRRGFASGLAVSAFGLSTVVFTPVSKWLMNRFTDSATGLVNFHMVFIVLAGVFFVCGIIACMFVRLPEQDDSSRLKISQSQSEAANNFTLAQAIKTVPFWCIFLSIFFINGTWNLTVPLIYDLGTERGLTAAMATLAVSFTGIPNAAGRLIMATLSDKIGRVTTMYILAFMTLAGAVLMIFVEGYAYIAVVSLIAFAFGGPSALNAAMTTDFFGPKNSGTNYGVVMTALGISSIVFNAISNNILGGNVSATFIMAAITAVVPMFLMVIITRCKKNWNK